MIRGRRKWNAKLGRNTIEQNFTDTDHRFVRSNIETFGRHERTRCPKSGNRYVDIRAELNSLREHFEWGGGGERGGKKY